MVHILPGHPTRGKPAQMSPKRAADPNVQQTHRQRQRECHRHLGDPTDPTGDRPTTVDTKPTPPARRPDIRATAQQSSPVSEEASGLAARTYGVDRTQALTPTGGRTPPRSYP